VLKAVLAKLAVYFSPSVAGFCSLAWHSCWL